MNRLIENGSVKEQPCGSNFAYVLEDSGAFLSTEYKVLQSQEDGYFLRCMKFLYNGKMQFYYLAADGSEAIYDSQADMAYEVTDWLAAIHKKCMNEILRFE